MSPDQGHGCYCGPDEKCEVCRPETPAFDPEYDTPLYHCSECGRELRRDSCRKCGTENNPASNWIPNGKKQRPAPPPAPRDEAHASDGTCVDGHPHRCARCDRANYRFQNDAEGALRSPAVNDDDGAKAREALEGAPRA